VLDQWRRITKKRAAGSDDRKAPRAKRDSHDSWAKASWSNKEGKVRFCGGATLGRETVNEKNNGVWQ